MHVPTSKNMGNQTMVLGFILLGFSCRSDVQVALFSLFLFIYVITLLWNIIVISLITTNPKLHTPMYFFLCVLSCLDICSVSVTIPRMLMDMLAQRKLIAFSECITQLFAIQFLEFSDAFILTAMCYDRYVAICYPLYYTVVMSRRFCIHVVAFTCMISVLLSFINSFLISLLPFCGENNIDNFLCEFPALLKLACADILTNEIVLFALAGSMAVITFTIIVMSYMHIIRVILKIPSKEGKQKVFSTCSAHLMVVCLFFGAGASTHLKPVRSSTKQDKVASLFYTVFAAMLNPVIYSLRNEDMKQALWKAIHQYKWYM